VAADQSPVRAELDRVGATFRKAGAADYITGCSPGCRTMQAWPLCGECWALSEARRLVGSRREEREVRSFRSKGGFGGDWHCEVVQQ
jgi:hypothetical protein